MKNLFWALFLAATAAFGQGSAGVTKLTPVAPDTAMPAGKIYIKLSSLPGRRPGQNTSTFKISCTSAASGDNASDCGWINSGNTGSLVPNRYSASINSGSFRTLCFLSHFAFDDPIVWPGQPGKTHLHQFFGNTSTSAFSAIDDMSLTGNSTCYGGRINKTGYWVPPLVYHCAPGMGALYGCTESRNGEVMFAKIGNFYYKCADADPCDTIQWPGVGLRIIAGNPTNTGVNFGGAGISEGYSTGTVYRFECNTNNTYDHIPSSADLSAIGNACNDFNMNWSFPQCWDGVNLYLPSSVSKPYLNQHMAYKDYYNGCNNPAYPIRIPHIQLNVHYDFSGRVADIPFMRLSSDQPRTSATGACATAAKNYCAGATMHADWVNGWDHTANFQGWGQGTFTDILLKQCYSKGYTTGGGTYTPHRHSDCHDNLFGNPNPGNDKQWFTLY